MQAVKKNFSHSVRERNIIMADEEKKNEPCVKIVTVLLRADYQGNEEAPLTGKEELEKALNDGWYVDRTDKLELSGENPKAGILLYILKRTTGH